MAYTIAQQKAISEFSNVGKLSDFVRDLGKFDGKPSDLFNWISDVEGVFALHKDLPRQCTEFGLLERTIRRKVVGEANDVLNSNNVFNDWNSIKSTLLLYYRDKRDVKTLDYELTTVKKRGNESLSAYFSRVNDLLTNIIAQVQTDVDMCDAAASHCKYFRAKALDSFIRGLEKPLNMLLKSANVSNLNQAYHFCMDYYNMDMRSAPFRDSYPQTSGPKPVGLEVPRGFVYRPQIPPPRPHIPISRPEPMDVDRSVNTRQADYNHRTNLTFPQNPSYNAIQKRPHPPSSQQHLYKRQAHPIDTEEIRDSNFNSVAVYSDDATYSYVQPNQHLHQEQEFYYDHHVDDRSVEAEINPESTHFLEWNPRW